MKNATSISNQTVLEEWALYTGSLLNTLATESLYNYLLRNYRFSNTVKAIIFRGKDKSKVQEKDVSLYYKRNKTKFDNEKYQIDDENMSETYRSYLNYFNSGKRCVFSINLCVKKGILYIFGIEQKRNTNKRSPEILIHENMRYEIIKINEDFTALAKIGDKIENIFVDWGSTSRGYNLFLKKNGYDLKKIIKSLPDVEDLSKIALDAKKHGVIKTKEILENGCILSGCM